MISPHTPTRVQFSMISAPCLTMNQRLHWTKQRELARRWRYAAGIYARLAEAPKGLPRSMVQVSFPVKQQRRRDPHNWAPTVKAIVDGLVDAQVFEDDSSEYVLVEDSTFHPAADHEYVVITIKPLEAP